MVSLCCIRTLKFFTFFAIFVFPLVFMGILIRNYMYIIGSPRSMWKKENRAFSNLTKVYDGVLQDYKKQTIRAEDHLKKLKKAQKDQINQTAIHNMNSIIKKLKKLYVSTKDQHKNLSRHFNEYTDTIQKHKYGYLQYLMALTAMYWMSDLINIGAVGFMPVTVGPLMKILQAEVIIKSYMRSSNMMILCGSIIALGAIPAGLDKRISFRVLALCGNNKRRMATCIMLISLIFSMWWINTAVMVFMSSVIDEMVHELREGISFGTLGETRMKEWNRIQEVLAHAKARKKARKDEMKKHTFETNLTDPPVSTSETISTPTVPTTLVPAQPTPAQPTPAEPAPAPSTTFENRVSRASVYSAHSDVVDLTARGSMQLGQIVAFESKKKVSYGHAENLRHEELRHETRIILEDIRRTLHHCAAVMCSVGGLFWTYNSPNNIQLFHDSAIRGLSSVNWTIWSFPIMLITVPLTMFCLDLSHFGPNFISGVLIALGFKDPEQDQPLDTDVSYDTAEEILWTFQDKHYDLGPMSCHGKLLILLMIIFIVLLLIRMAGSPTGALGELLYKRQYARKAQIEDASILAIAVIIGFFFPQTFKQIFAKPKTPTEKPSFPTILDWKPVQQNFPWGVLLIVGASTSFAEMYETAGLDILEINRFKGLHNQFGKEITLFVAMLYTLLVSNAVGSSCGAIFAARFLSKVDSSCFYSLPCVTASNFAFLFPVGTSTMSVASLKMDGIHGWYCIKKGLIPSIVCPLIVYVFGLSYAKLIPCTLKPTNYSGM